MLRAGDNQHCVQPVAGTIGLKKRKGKAKQNPQTNSSVVGASGRILEDLGLTQNLFLTRQGLKSVWFGSHSS